MFETEVDYRLAKWLIANMQRDGIITDAEMQEAWKKLADYYDPPFLAVDAVGGKNRRWGGGKCKIELLQK